ncbi:MAG: glycosyltransferase [Chitinispirillaceae bacterium]|nr:glycosyltransferase [Chitinispirillaceae bacterium]
MGAQQSPAEKTIKINWEGSLFVHHSLGMVNRELMTELIKFPHLTLRHIPYEPEQFTPGKDSKYWSLTALRREPHHDADIHIRHRWPPDFSRPPSGKFILMQPWEYGSLPVSWCEAIAETVDEVWVYSRFLKICYERSGIPADKVKIVPNGIDPLCFNPNAPPAPWVRQASGNRYRFLFNGGVTTRKGADVLINAYLSEFRSDEPVCLVIKDSDMYVKGISAKVRELASRDDIARMVYTSDSIPHEQLPGLYTSCNCYVHPYRAEGYGLPIAEAMACGLPVIVTGGGACLDFVEPGCGYFVKCSLETMKSKQVSNLATVDYPFWLMPDTGHLRSIMRYIFENKEEARQRGRNAAETVRSVHTWENAAVVAERRFRALLGRLSAEENEKTPALERRARIDRAVSLLQAGAYDDAIDAFQKILLRYDKSSLAYEGLAIAAFYKKNYEEACSLFAAANRLSHDNVNIIVNWYEAAKTIHAADQLIEPVQRALQLHRDNDELRAIAVEMGIL